MKFFFQLIHIYNKKKDRKSDDLKWGDEVEYMILRNNQGKFWFGSIGSSLMNSGRTPLFKKSKKIAKISFFCR